ncbi:hypothetical protein HSX37_14150|uniref:Membrane protein involved in the export of O-antigen and teichoic acid n=1 Tax=Dendrosporobacter quercicolus TaxID=146817 RepID=A0A1G9WPJ1_9FIRM|nr:hypothetical protein [Dendrosporobacter quercicolus]NSL49173.1 hypothetical protein [Dendrosporobacter quercicolus DSM 1736]SDM86452.1 Membrane protein involved in the export of O-antigen and teichoic acid [Dendrosporobacter quercicolus]
MNEKAKTFLENFSYTFVSTLVSLLISTLVVIILPKLLGIQEYGYWQLYLFYASYVGMMQFGWNDGIYLRYGGKEYSKLDKSLFFSQFWLLVISQLLIACFIIIITFSLVKELERQYIYVTVAICMIIMGIRAMPLLILQATNRIKEYAKIVMVDRISYCFLITAFLFLEIKEYKLMIIADLIGKLISLLYSMNFCKDIVFRGISTFYFDFREILENIKVGIKLTFANIASILIVGIVRFGIEYSWDVKTFGKISLSLNVSNFIIIFINTLGIIMFPILRRTNKKNLSGVYVMMRDVLIVILLGLLTIFYPLKLILMSWLPQYIDSFMYMALVFPMCLFEGKMALLINTYLKTLRRENFMLKINIISLILSVCITIITTGLLVNLNLAIASIVFLLIFRCIVAEIYLSILLKISLYKDILVELFMTLIFILVGWFINSWLTFFIYALSYLIFLITKRKDTISAIKNLRLLMKVRETPIN